MAKTEEKVKKIEEDAGEEKIKGVTLFGSYGGSYVKKDGTRVIKFELPASEAGKAAKVEQLTEMSLGIHVQVV